MAKKSEKEQTSALDEVRRHVRVFIDLSQVAGESNDENRFLDQAVVQVARAVEIDHVKVLKYRRREADLLVTAGFGWKEGVVRSATLSADLRSPPGRCFQTAQPVVIKKLPSRGRLHPFGPAAGARHHLAGKCPGADSRCSVGCSGGRQHATPRFQPGHHRVSHRHCRADRRVPTGPQPGTE